MAVMVPTSDHSHAGTALSVTAAIAAITAGGEKRWAMAQEAAMWPTVLPVAEFGWSGAAFTNTELHRCGLHSPTQVQLRLTRASQ